MKLKLIELNSVTSTNDEAIKLIKENNLNPHIISAKIQKKGRGTMGKKWISMNGNLFISIFFKINLQKIKIGEFLKINTNLLKSIISEYTSFKISIKSPNDILVNRRKICGILQEIIEHKNNKYLIIGIGINTISSPKDKKNKSISLVECTNYNINNSMIKKKIIKDYDKLIFDITFHNLNYIKKKYL